MITLHDYPKSMYTFTIEWWELPSYFVVCVFLGYGSFALDHSSRTYEDALKEGNRVCSIHDAWVKRGLE